MKIKLALFVLLCFPAAAQETSQSTRLTKTDLLVVTAHPDDESMMAATMARYSDEGRAVSLAVCTRGEGGGNSTGKESGAALGIVREAELRRCLSLLGTRDLHFLGRQDWAYTESVRATLAKWGHRETLRELVRLVRVLKPTVIVTMDPAPTGGQHGHHQAAGRLATEAFGAAADANAFPELFEDEGLAPWTVSKLYWTGGSSTATTITTDGTARGALAAASPGKRYGEIAAAAESHHKSQGFDRFFGTPQAGTMMSRPNRFTLVKSRVASEMPDTDLFAGTGPSTPMDTRDLLSVANAETGHPLTVRIRPRPAVQDYRRWLRSQGIERLMARLPAEVPVTIGLASPVNVDILNAGKSEQTGRVLLNLPPGWRVDASSKHFRVKPGGSTSVSYRVTPPPTARVAAHDVKAAIVAQDLADTGKLDAVPLLTIPRLKRTMPVDADSRKWIAAGYRPTEIAAHHVAQGASGRTEESSGRFFVGYDSTGIQVLVDVLDDTVVRNIAPDDIKAHWRSTSTEICIDPQPRAENTLSALKLGIFPADTTGKARAARDADANPGPIDRREPSIRIASRTTRGGYVVEARIPWRVLRTPTAFRPGSGMRLGFNVILYHAGKADAKVGEDVNKSRLAWSYWGGVWGRPEVWGTAILQ